MSLDYARMNLRTLIVYRRLDFKDRYLQLGSGSSFTVTPTLNSIGVCYLIFIRVILVTSSLLRGQVEGCMNLTCDKFISCASLSL